MHADEIRKAIAAIRQLTDKAFAINLFVPEKHQATQEQIERASRAIVACSAPLHLKSLDVKPPYAPAFEEQLEVILEEKVPVFSFTFGIPHDPWLDRLKAAGIFTIGTATTLAEGNLLEQSGVDAVVAQGSEAGGHRGTFLTNAEEGLLPLAEILPRMAAQLSIPVIAAGGIMDGHAIKAALNAGAAAVQMGTAFLCCTESGIAPAYKQALLAGAGDSTVLTRVFSGKMARGIENEFMVKMKAHANDVAPYPIQNALTQPMRRAAKEQDVAGYMSLWAGQGVAECREVSVAELIELLGNEMLW